MKNTGIVFIKDKKVFSHFLKFFKDFLVNTIRKIPASLLVPLEAVFSGQVLHVLERLTIDVAVPPLEEKKVIL